MTKYKNSIDYQHYKFVIQPPAYSQKQVELLDATIPTIRDTLGNFYEWYPKKVWVNNDTIGVYMVPLRYLQCGLDTFNNKLLKKGNKYILIPRKGFFAFLSKKVLRPDKNAKILLHQCRNKRALHIDRTYFLEAFPDSDYIIDSIYNDHKAFEMAEKMDDEKFKEWIEQIYDGILHVLKSKGIKKNEAQD